LEEQQTAADTPVNESLPPKRRFSFNGRFVLWLNYIAIACLLLSYLAPYVSPRVFWPMAFFGIAYPVLLLINLLFVAYWLIRWRMRFLYSFCVVLLGIQILNGYVQFNPQSKADAGKNSKYKLKVMSFNTKLFDLYNWTHNLETRSKIFDLLKMESPDIICMQEFYNSDKGTFRNLDTLVKLQKAKYSHCEYTVTLRKTDHWGMATFSSYPIVNRGHIDFNVSGNNSCIYTDIKIGEDTLRVYNMHLQSMHFSNSDYKFMEEFFDTKDVNELEGSRTILRRLKWAFRRRAGQADIISEHVRNCRYPVLLCGDFNDTPASYTYHTLSRGLKDAFLESGNGFGRTYYGKFPSFRIDYILHNASIPAWDFRTIVTDLSDHYPISCTIGVGK
jgi:endonuclease/exonuclease/phosphatase family metal-dependent hydrolase